MAFCKNIRQRASSSELSIKQSTNLMLCPADGQVIIEHSLPRIRKVATATIVFAVRSV